MKKLLLPVVLACSALYANAEYSSTEKTIKVVLTQGPAGGLAHMYRHIENFASKNNIKMTPVFKPGGNGSVGLNYGAGADSSGDTIIFGITSDVLNFGYTNKLEAVSAVNLVNFDLIASKKSKLTTFDEVIEKEKTSPGSSNWGVVNSAHMDVIKTISSVAGIDKNKITTISYSGRNTAAIVTNIIGGDIDLVLFPPSLADVMVQNQKVTKISVPEDVLKSLDARSGKTAIFLPKNANTHAVKYWEEFFKKFVTSAEVIEVMKNEKIKLADPGKTSLVKILEREQ